MFKEQISKYLKNKTNINEVEIANIPNTSGIYIIGKKFPQTKFEILDTTTAIEIYKGQNLLFSQEELLYKFKNSDDEILYIGKAESKMGLRNRINQLLRYANKECANHRGGKALWQIKNWQEELVLYWCEINNARKIEQELLISHSNEHYCAKGKKYSYPFANWKN